MCSLVAHLWMCLATLLLLMQHLLQMQVEIQLKVCKPLYTWYSGFIIFEDTLFLKKCFPPIEESTNNGWEVAVGVVIAALVAVVAVIVIIAIILCTRRSRRTSSKKLHVWGL